MRAADHVQKITLADFYRWSSPSFCENHRPLSLTHGAHRPEAPIFEQVRRGVWGKRMVLLYKTTNGANPRLFVERGDELREPSYLLEYPDIDKLDVAFHLTFGDIAWAAT
jgi:hypothetical protein